MRWQPRGAAGDYRQNCGGGGEHHGISRSQAEYQASDQLSERQRCSNADGQPSGGDQHCVV